MNIIKAWYHIWAIIKRFFFRIIYREKIKIGKNTTWRRNFSVMLGDRAELQIGKDCFFNNQCTIGANGSVIIGDGSIFGENVKIYDHNHRFSNIEKSIKSQGYSNGKIRIGKHCWIGSNVCILKNADIGNNCVIGAGCVISEKIEDNTIVKRDNQYIVEVLDFVVEDR